MTAATSKSLERIRSLILTNQGIYSKGEVIWSYVYKNNSVFSSWNSTSIDISVNGELLSNKSLVLVPNLQKCQIQLFQSDFVINIVSTNKKSIFVKLNSYKDYETLLGCLMVWQNLKPSGLLNKWNFNRSIIYNSNLKPNNLLVCRFKVYGPLPNNKKVKVSRLPENPLYPSDSVGEGWFIAIGHLKPNGILDLLCESDGSMLYSIDITRLYSSEIKEIHHSIFQNSNILFLGQINELRNLHSFKNEIDNDELENYITCNDNKKFQKVRRILIDFELRIDLEDWLVTLTSFTKLEFIGNGFIQQKMRVIKNCKLEIVEAKFNNSSLKDSAKYIYSELVMWNSPWFRTAIVENYSNNPFWKELFEVNLPSSTEFLKILIKSAPSKDLYNNNFDYEDEILGATFITPDVIMQPQFMKRIPIYNNNNEEMGQLVINLNRDESHILPYQNYKIVEKMLVNLKVDELINFVEPLIEPENLEPWSIMLLDIYQTLNREHDFFKSLMKLESEPIDSMTINNRIRKSNSKNGINTIFRGNSILTKSLEKYALRVGQEYLEKLLTGFISQITEENLNCECDPKLDPDNHQSNYQNLLRYMEHLWNKIYTSSNDLPSELKEEWKHLRQSVEMSVDPTDKETPLNALSSFIFLRYLCPAILNPKLFNLTKNHQSGRISRTLTLIAKVLIVFANRGQFLKHKEPFLLGLNEDFLNVHNEEMLIYFDRMTGRKMDFNEKKLAMSNLVERPSLNVSNEVLNELPTMPYLIDKYLMIYKLIKILDDNNNPESRNEVEINNRNAKITDLKFEILGFDETDLGSEEFIKNLLDDEDEDFNKSLLKQNISLKELMNQSSMLIKKTKRLEKTLSKPEIPTIFTHESWTTFIDTLIKSIKIDKNGFVVYDISVGSSLELSKKVVSGGGDSSGFDGFIRNLIQKNEITRSESIQSMIALPEQNNNSNGSSKNVLKKLFGRKKSVV